MKSISHFFSGPISGGPLLARSVQILLACAGVAIVAAGFYRLPQLEPGKAETAVVMLLVLVLAMQFFLAAMIFPLTNCLLRRTRVGRPNRNQ